MDKEKYSNIAGFLMHDRCIDDAQLNDMVADSRIYKMTELSCTELKNEKCWVLFGVVSKIAPLSKEAKSQKIILRDGNDSEVDLHIDRGDQNFMQLIRTKRIFERRLVVIRNPTVERTSHCRGLCLKGKDISSLSVSILNELCTP